MVFPLTLFPTTYVCLRLNHVLRTNNYIYTKFDLVIIVLNLLQYDDTELHNMFAHVIRTWTANIVTTLLESNVKEALLEFYYFKYENIIEYLKQYHSTFLTWRGQIGRAYWLGEQVTKIRSRKMLDKSKLHSFKQNMLFADND